MFVDILMLQHLGGVFLSAVAVAASPPAETTSCAPDSVATGTADGAGLALSSLVGAGSSTCGWDADCTVLDGPDLTSKAADLDVDGSAGICLLLTAALAVDGASTTTCGCATASCSSCPAVSCSGCFASELRIGAWLSSNEKSRYTGQMTEVHA